MPEKAPQTWTQRREPPPGPSAGPARPRKMGREARESRSQGLQVCLDSGGHTGQDQVWIPSVSMTAPDG